MMADDDLFSFLTDGKTETSREAGESIKAHVSRLEGMVLDYIRSRGAYGATCCEIERALGMPHQTASARCTGLKIKKLVHPDGRRRLTIHGKDADVLVG
jgi:hypothetical protein